jgi:hypothetical protein
MSLSAAERAGLAAQQTALVSALLAGGEVPGGFDTQRVRATADALARKRERSVARAWPELARDLGERFHDLFAAYAVATPLPAHGGPLADGRLFAGWLARRGELPESSRLQVLAVDLRYTVSADGLARRRRPAFRVAVLDRPRRLVLAVRWSWLGERWLSIALPGARP